MPVFFSSPYAEPTVCPAHIIFYVTLKDNTGNNIKKCPDFFNLDSLFLI